MKWLLTCGLLLVAAPLFAQTGALTTFTVQYFQNGAILPTQVQTIALPAGMNCGQALRPAPPPVTFITTAALIVVTDPANAALNCEAVQTPGSVLLSLPLGASYTATSTYTNDFGVASQPSGASNSFTRGSAPAPNAPTGLQIRQR